jgi:SAM-dependent methyltransferase
MIADLLRSVTPGQSPPGSAHAGAEYVRAITARESDRRARAAFRRLVLRLVPPAGTVLDFGAGAGLDARYFAHRGLAVRAYDNDPRMCEFLARHCHDLIESGSVRVEAGSYEEFLARGRAEEGQRVDLVAANFAPLNLIADLPSLFARFHARTVPDGKVVASVLNPFFIGDAKYRWWWWNLPRLWQSGRYVVPGALGGIVRRTPADFAAQSAPWFTLERLYRGLPPRDMRDAEGTRWSGDGRAAVWRLCGCRFIFLVFRRRDPSSE